MTSHQDVTSDQEQAPQTEAQTPPPPVEIPKWVIASSAQGHSR